MGIHSSSEEEAYQTAFKQGRLPVAGHPRKIDGDFSEELGVTVSNLSRAIYCGSAGFPSSVRFITRTVAGSEAVKALLRICKDEFYLLRHQSNINPIMKDKESITYVGIDIAKEKLDLAIPTQPLITVKNNPHGIQEIVEKLQPLSLLPHVVLEPTGTYGRDLTIACMLKTVRKLTPMKVVTPYFPF
jgi:hypothetical protein